MEIRASLPIPPSNNRYYRHARGRTYLSAEGRAYRDEVGWLLNRTRMQGPLKVVIDVYPKDKRVCDIDNYPKAIFDALTFANVWDDDSQVKDLHIRFSGFDRNHPRVMILIIEIFDFCMEKKQ